VPTHEPWVWGGFSALVLILLVLDLGVLNRRSHVLSMKEATTWSAGLITMALLFGLFFLWREGTGPALEYYSGYLIELSLSVDNLFVFLLIFQYFAVPAELQPRVLKWGIVSAIVLRGIMITLGAILLVRFHWIIYVFGGILILTGIRMFRSEEIRIEPEKNPLVKLVRRVFPVTPAYEDAHFFVKPLGARRWIATPLLLVLVVVEWSDIVFAIDSIPAIFAVTKDPFIVYSSNVFAILGLRALYFVLAGAMDKFNYLKPAVAAILVFVGIKMTVSGWIHVATPISLGVIIGLLVMGIVASMVHARREAVLPPDAR
jgi:tellurite resistance protein TerC